MNGLLGIVGQHFIDDAAQVLDLDGLGQKAGIGRIRHFGKNVSGARFAAHKENRGFGGRVIAPEGFEKMRSGIAGHMIIEQDQVGAKRPTDLHPFGGIVGTFNNVILRSKGNREQSKQVGVVIDYQNFRHSYDSIGSCGAAVKGKSEDFCRN